MYREKAGRKQTIHTCWVYNPIQSVVPVRRHPFVWSRRVNECSCICSNTCTIWYMTKYSHTFTNKQRIRMIMSIHRSKRCVNATRRGCVFSCLSLKLIVEYEGPCLEFPLKLSRCNSALFNLFPYQQSQLINFQPFSRVLARKKTPTITEYIPETRTHQRKHYSEEYRTKTTLTHFSTTTTMTTKNGSQLIECIRNSNTLYSTKYTTSSPGALVAVCSFHLPSNHEPCCRARSSSISRASLFARLFVLRGGGGAHALDGWCTHARMVTFQQATTQQGF